jgi:hypothetical protein
MDVGAVKGGQETKYVIPTFIHRARRNWAESPDAPAPTYADGRMGPRGQRLNSLDDFPAAEFLYYDLDCYHEIFSQPTRWPS